MTHGSFAVFSLKGVARDIRWTFESIGINGAMEHTQRSSHRVLMSMGNRETDHILQSQLTASMPGLPFVRRPKPKPTLSPVQTCSSSSAPRLRGACASNCAAFRAVEGRRGGGQSVVGGGIGVESKDCWADIEDEEDVLRVQAVALECSFGGFVSEGG